MQNFKNSKESRLIGEILLEKGLITRDQLDKALLFQKEKGDFICNIIVKSGFAQPQEIYKALSEQIGVDYIDLKKEKIDLKAIEKVPPKFAIHYKLIPCGFKDKKLVVALADPLDIHKLDDLTLLLDINIEPALAYEEDILKSIQKYYGVGAEILEDIMAREDFGAREKQKNQTIEDLEAAVEDASIIKFVNQIMAQAVEERATDIHLEPFENELRVRFRIDGFLYDVPIPESIRFFHPAIVSRVKIMSGLDIAEHRLPQDGRIKIRVKGEELDLRVSILPSSFGESVQIRILGTRFFMGLENLGLMSEEFKKIEELISKPYGVIFVTGPTGSGKSTTLYACLSRKNSPN
ncbi:MAG: type II secretion system protein GspE, partial [Candidatus Omnitrophica bacterium CG11_big_fil_rev_8_21_14_0_20_42_13]